MSPLLLALALDPRAALEAGDAAWMAGQRGEARDAWQQAAEGAEGDVATEARAEIRLLRVSSNLGWMAHGRRIDRALAQCPAMDPWCDLAEAELELTLRDLGLGGDLTHAEHMIDSAGTRLPEAAEALREWQASGWPPGPGTSTLGLSVIGGPGLGVGGVVRWVQPDLGWRAIRLDLSAMGTSRGSGALSLGWRTPGAHPAAGSLGLSRATVDLYEAGGVNTVEVDQITASAAPILRGHGALAWAGPLFRLDRDEDWAAGHGAFGGASWDGRKEGVGPYARLTGEVALVDYAFGRLTLDLRESVRVGPPLLAARVWVDAVPWTDEGTPPWRLPSVGGSDLLRGAPAGVYRGARLAAGALELRQGIGPTVELVGFGELALVEGTGGPHPGGGLGLRLRLPPRPDNTLRLDLGFTDAGWGLVASWGETF